MEVQVEKWSTLNQTAAESVKKASTINKNLLMSLSQQQMDIMSIYVEGGVKQAQLLTEPCNAKSVLSTQADLVQEFTKKLLNNFRVSFEIAMDARTEFSSLYQANAQEFAGQWLSLTEKWPQTAMPAAKAKVTVTVSEPPAPKLIAATPVVTVEPEVVEVVKEAVEVVKAAAEEVKAQAAEVVQAVVEEVKPQVEKVVKAVEEQAAAPAVVEEDVKPVKKAAASTKTVAEKATSIKTATKTTANRGRSRKPPAPKV